MSKLIDNQTGKALSVGANSVITDDAGKHWLIVSSSANEGYVRVIEFHELLKRSHTVSADSLDLAFIE